MRGIPPYNDLLYPRERTRSLLSQAQQAEQTNAQADRSTNSSQQLKMWNYLDYNWPAQAPPRLIYCQSFTESEEAAYQLLTEECLAFDLILATSAPSPQQTLANEGPEIGKAVVAILLASENEVVIFHLPPHRKYKTSVIAPSLQVILESRTQIKVGVNIVRDGGITLRSQFGLIPGGLFELSRFHSVLENTKEIPPPAHKGAIPLKVLVEQYLHLPQPDGIDTVGGFGARPFSRRQQEQAANQVCVMLALNHAMNQKQQTCALSTKRPPTVSFLPPFLACTLGLLWQYDGDEMETSSVLGALPTGITPQTRRQLLVSSQMSNRSHQHGKHSKSAGPSIVKPHPDTQEIYKIRTKDSKGVESSFGTQTQPLAPSNELKSALYDPIDLGEDVDQQWEYGSDSNSHSSTPATDWCSTARTEELQFQQLIARELASRSRLGQLSAKMLIHIGYIYETHYVELHQEDCKRRQQKGRSSAEPTALLHFGISVARRLPPLSLLDWLALPHYSSEAGFDSQFTENLIMVAVRYQLDNIAGGTQAYQLALPVDLVWLNLMEHNIAIVKQDLLAATEHLKDPTKKKPPRPLPGVFAPRDAKKLIFPWQYKDSCWSVVSITPDLDTPVKRGEILLYDSMGPEKLETNGYQLLPLFAELYGASLGWNQRGWSLRRGQAPYQSGSDTCGPLVVYTTVQLARELSLPECTWTLEQTVDFCKRLRLNIFYDLYSLLLENNLLAHLIQDGEVVRCKSTLCNSSSVDCSQQSGITSTSARPRLKSTTAIPLPLLSTNWTESISQELTIASLPATARAPQWLPLGPQQATLPPHLKSGRTQLHQPRHPLHIAQALTPTQIQSLPSLVQDVIDEDGYLDREALSGSRPQDVPCLFACGATFGSYAQAALHLIDRDAPPHEAEKLLHNTQSGIEGDIYQIGQPPPTIGWCDNAIALVKKDSCLFRYSLGKQVGCSRSPVLTKASAWLQDHLLEPHLKAHFLFALDLTSHQHIYSKRMPYAAGLPCRCGFLWPSPEFAAVHLLTNLLGPSCLGVPTTAAEFINDAFDICWPEKELTFVIELFSSIDRQTGHLHRESWTAYGDAPGKHSNTEFMFDTIMEKVPGTGKLVVFPFRHIGVVDRSNQYRATEAFRRHRVAIVRHYQHSFSSTAPTICFELECASVFTPVVAGSKYWAMLPKHRGPEGAGLQQGYSSWNEGLRALYQSTIVTSAVFRVFETRAPQDRILLCVTNSWTSCAPLLAYACLLYDFRLHIGLTESEVQMADSACSHQNTLEKALTSNGPQCYGYRFGRHWFELESMMFARAFMGMETNALAEGYLRWCVTSYSSEEENQPLESLQDLMKMQLATIKGEMLSIIEERSQEADNQRIIKHANCSGAKREDARAVQQKQVGDACRSALKDQAVDPAPTERAFDLHATSPTFDLAALEQSVEHATMEQTAERGTTEDIIDPATPEPIFDSSTAHQDWRPSHIAPPLTSLSIKNLPTKLQPLINSDGYVDEWALKADVVGGVPCHFQCGQRFDNWAQSAIHLIAESTLNSNRVEIKESLTFPTGARKQLVTSICIADRNNKYLSLCPFQESIGHHIECDSTLKEKKPGSDIRSVFTKVFFNNLSADLLHHQGRASLPKDMPTGLPCRCGILWPTPQFAALHLFTEVLGPRCSGQDITLETFFSYFKLGDHYKLLTNEAEIYLQAGQGALSSAKADDTHGNFVSRRRSESDNGEGFASMDRLVLEAPASGTLVVFPYRNPSLHRAKAKEAAANFMAQMWAEDYLDYTNVFGSRLPVVKFTFSSENCFYPLFMGTKEWEDTHGARVGDGDTASTFLYTSAGLYRSVLISDTILRLFTTRSPQDRILVVTISSWASNLPLLAYMCALYSFRLHIGLTSAEVATSDSASNNASSSDSESEHGPSSIQKRFKDLLCPSEPRFCGEYLQKGTGTLMLWFELDSTIVARVFSGLQSDALVEGFLRVCRQYTTRRRKGRVAIHPMRIRMSKAVHGMEERVRSVLELRSSLLTPLNTNPTDLEGGTRHTTQQSRGTVQLPKTQAVVAEPQAQEEASTVPQPTAQQGVQIQRAGAAPLSPHLPIQALGEMASLTKQQGTPHHSVQYHQQYIAPPLTPAQVQNLPAEIQSVIDAAGYVSKDALYTEVEGGVECQFRCGERFRSYSQAAIHAVRWSGLGPTELEHLGYQEGIVESMDPNTKLIPNWCFDSLEALSSVGCPYQATLGDHIQCSSPWGRTATYKSLKRKMASKMINTNFSNDHAHHQGRGSCIDDKPQGLPCRCGRLWPSPQFAALHLFTDSAGPACRERPLTVEEFLLDINATGQTKEEQQNWLIKDSDLYISYPRSDSAFKTPNLVDLSGRIEDRLHSPIETLLRTIPKTGPLTVFPYRGSYASEKDRVKAKNNMEEAVNQYLEIFPSTGPAAGIFFIGDAYSHPLFVGDPVWIASHGIWKSDTGEDVVRTQWLPRLSIDRSALVSEAVFRMLDTRLPEHRVLLVCGSSWSLSAPLLAWACAIQDFRLCIGLTATETGWLVQRKTGFMDNAARQRYAKSVQEQGRKLFKPDDPRYRGLYCARYWFELESRTLARVFAGLQHDELAEGYLNFCRQQSNLHSGSTSTAGRVEKAAEDMKERIQRLLQEDNLQR